MSLTKYMYAAAVPFHIARLQNGISSQLIRKTAEFSLKQNGDSEDMQVKRPRKRRRLDHLSIEEKLRLRKLKNRESSQISRERARQQKEHLEKQLLELQIEKMKLLLENEQLKAQSICLEKENENLKKSLQSTDDQMQDNRSERLEVTFKHASFVNIPLLKEWVLPQLFMIMIVTLKEILMTSFQAQNLGKIQVMNIHHTANCMKLIQNAVCLIKGMRIFPMNCFKSLILFNG